MAHIHRSVDAVFHPSMGNLSSATVDACAAAVCETEAIEQTRTREVNRMTPVIEAAHLHKKYDTFTAVQDVSFQVGQGEIFGIIGRNGAGKTTLVECTVGLRQPTAGSVRVLGLDPARDTHALREQIGIQLQQSALPDRMKVGEALDLFASFYRTPADWRALLDAWGMADKRKTDFVQLSGGQKQRLFIMLALINQPRIVFLDEMTTGLDPRARRATWELIRRVRDAGTTVVLVSHFMDEVQALCDRVAVIEGGRLIALDTPAALQGAHPSLEDAFMALTGQPLDTFEEV
jgi:ABC-2 type transport system ATP-binding protein